MTPATKPEGGYRLLPINHLCVAWWAYKSQRVSWLAFRVFLALHEVAERRKVATLQRDKRGVGLWRDTIVAELQLLVRCARASQARAALAQLERVGLLRQEAGLVQFEEHLELGRQAGAMAGRALRRGTIPVPRRVLCYLASKGSTAVAAYMLGVTIRCCHVRAGGEYKSRGRCSIRFVAELFGLHVRTVKRAAATVVPLGWVEKEPANDRWARRYGPVVRVNTQWRCVGIKSPPRQTANGTGSPPAMKKQELLTDPMNQEPAVVPAAHQSYRETGRPNALRSLSMNELRDPDRLMSRFRQAVGAGMLAECSAAKLQFFAAAQHALRVATRNPCGLFATVVRQGLWRFLSQADEDRARAILRRLASDDRQRQPISTPNKPLDGLIMSLVGKVAWPTARVETKSRTTAATCSKKLASSTSPDTASSLRMASSESMTDSTFSARAARKAICSSSASAFIPEVSIPRACHGSARFGNRQNLDFAPDRVFGQLPNLKARPDFEKTVSRRCGNLKANETRNAVQQ